jgi:hypothetical protein
VAVVAVVAAVAAVAVPVLVMAELVCFSPLYSDLLFVPALVFLSAD